MSPLSPTTSASAATPVALNTWAKLATTQAPGARRYAGMAEDPIRHQIVLFGGSQVQQNGPPLPLQDTWLWDEKNESWSRWCPQQNCPSPPADYTNMAFDGQNIVAFVGTGPGGSTWIWTGGSWSQNTTSPQPPGSSSGGFGAMAYDQGRGQVFFLTDTNSGVVGSPDKEPGSGTASTGQGFRRHRRTRRISARD